MTEGLENDDRKSGLWQGFDAGQSFSSAAHAFLRQLNQIDSVLPDKNPARSTIKASRNTWFWRSAGLSVLGDA